MSRSVGSEGLLVKVVVPKSKIKITWWHHKWLFCQISGSLLSHRRRNCFPLVLHYILYVFHSILFWCRWKQTSVERRELPLLSGACRGIDQSLLHISINCSFTETINTYDITTLISTGEESTGLGITAADWVDRHPRLLSTIRPDWLHLLTVAVHILYFQDICQKMVSINHLIRVWGGKSNCTDHHRFLYPDVSYYL